MQMQGVQVARDNPAAAAAGHDTAVVEVAAHYGQMLWVLFGGPCAAVPDLPPAPAAEVAAAPMETGRGLALRVPKTDSGQHSWVRFQSLRHWVPMRQKGYRWRWRVVRR